MTISEIQAARSTAEQARVDVRASNRTDNFAAYAHANAALNSTPADNAYGTAKTSRLILSSSVTNTLLLQQEVSPTDTQLGLQRLADRYDVTNLSGHDRIALAQELRDGDFISAGVHLALTAPLSMAENLAENTNYLNTARKAFEAAFGRGSADQLVIQQERLEILEKLASLS